MTVFIRTFFLGLQDVEVVAVNVVFVKCLEWVIEHSVGSLHV